MSRLATSLPPDVHMRGSHEALELVDTIFLFEEQGTFISFHFSLTSTNWPS